METRRTPPARNRRAAQAPLACLDWEIDVSLRFGVWISKVRLLGPSLPRLGAALLSDRTRSRTLMLDEIIGKIEARIQTTDAINAERRRELLQLLGTLKSEVAELSKTHGEQAQSIAGFTELSAHEATRTEQNPHLLKLSLEGLGSSVAGFEESHPRLVQIVNAISNTLSNLGI
ncbi:MAG: hypothetical protein DME25_15095 [Verrucomicrobia bacterium]|nr:MAG: hypothetical protein DME25_15095 [Verrucomicrobiota bacterium]